MHTPVGGLVITILLMLCGWLAASLSVPWWIAFSCFALGALSSLVTIISMTK